MISQRIFRRNFIILIAALSIAVCAAVVLGRNFKVPSFHKLQSEHYMLRPDYDLYRYELFDGDGQKVAGAVDFYSPLILQDDAGLRILMTRYEDTDAYMPVVIDKELQRDLDETIGIDAGAYEPMSDYEIITDETTSLSYIIKPETPLDGGHVLLYDDEDVSTFTALAQLYADAYHEICPDVSTGYIYAALEVQQHAKRYEDGFFVYQPGSISYIDVKDTDRHWTLTLTYDEYISLSDYLMRGLPEFNLWDFKAWYTVFNRTGIEYDVRLDPESPRYQAAVADLERLWGWYPAPGMSEETAAYNLKNHMKLFDDEGYELNIYGIAGMNATDVPKEERAVIIDVPEEYLRAFFEHEKESLIKWRGLSRDADKKTKMYTAYQKAAPKEDRLKGTYTIQRYDRMYLLLMLQAVKRNDSDWKPGDKVDDNVLRDVTFEYAMEHIYSDGRTLSIIADPKLQKELDDASARMLEWMLR